MDKLQEIENRISTLKEQIEELKKQSSGTDPKFLGLCESWINELEKEKDRIISKRKEVQRLRELDTLGARARFSRLR